MLRFSHCQRPSAENGQLQQPGYDVLPALCCIYSRKLFALLTTNDSLQKVGDFGSLDLCAACAVWCEVCMRDVF